MTLSRLMRAKLTLLACLPAWAIAQSALDSMLRSLPAQRNDTGHARTLLRIGDALIEKGLNDSALIYLREGLSLAEAHEDLRLQAMARNSMGLSRSNASDHVAALEQMEHAYRLYQALGDTDRMQSARIDMAGELVAIGDHEQAQRIYLEGAAPCRSQGRPPDGLHVPGQHRGALCLPGEVRRIHRDHAAGAQGVR